MYTLSLILSVFGSAALLFMPAFVLFKDWRDQVHRYFAFFSGSAFIILFTMFITYAFPESPYLTQINRVTQLGTALLFGALLAISMVFPKREKPWPFRATVLILLPALVVSVIAVGTDFNITKAYFRDGVLVREFNFFYSVYALVVFTYLLLGMGNFIRKYVKTTVHVYRLQMRYMFVGTSIAAGVAAFASIILPRFFGYSDLYVLGPSLASFFALGSLFYSVLSYQLMDITTAAHKTFTYAVISMTILAPLYLVLQAYDSNLYGAGRLPSYIVAGGLVGIFILFSVFVQPAIDKVFKRKQYEFEGIIDNFVKDVEQLRDFRGIIQRSVDILQNSLFLKHAFFLMFSAEAKRFVVYYGKGVSGEISPLDRNSPVIRWFVRNPDVLTVERVYTDDREFSEIRNEFLDFFNANKLRLVMPIYHERRVLGLLCLGEKDTLAAFKPAEIEKLRSFLSGSNVHISNALAYEESKQQQMIARAMDLSSDILSRSAATALPNLTGIRFGAFVIPRYAEAVDYYDFIRPVTHGVGMIATDIAGVGINSALYSVVLRSALHSSVEEAPSAYSVMQRLNSVVYEYSEGRSELITAFYAYYDLRSMRLIYSNAGFPPLELYRIEKNDFDSLDTEGIPLGYDMKANYGMGRTNLLRGDIGVICSKALITSKNQKGESFGLVNLRAVVKESRMERPGEIANSIKERFLSYLGLLAPESDIVVIVFKIM